MDGNGGTPNPLNPTPEEDNKANEPVAEPENDLKFAEVGEVEEAKDSIEPASFAQTIKVEEVASEPEPEPEPTLEPEPETEPEPITESVEMGAVIDTEPTKSDMPDIPVAEPKIPVARNVVDPVMRPKKNNFDTLGMDDSGADEEIVNTPISNSTPELVAKDSIVEPENGGKKKALAIGAIVLAIVGLICGAAAIAIAMLGNNTDRVAKAIDKLINGESPNIISVVGNISAGDGSTETVTNIDFDGTFDLKTSANKVSANINTNLSSGTNMTFGVNEVRNKDGDTYLKISGLTDTLESSSDDVLKTTDGDDNTVTDCTKDGASSDTKCGPTTEVITTNCVGDNSGLTNCQPQGEDLTTSGLLSVYGGLFNVINDEWILISSDFGSAMGSMGLFDNSSTCMLEAFGSLKSYSKDIANKYKANPFVTYSTDNLKIAKKKNTLYKISVDENKLTAFVNSLSNNGFINELNACAGNVATNTDISVDAIKQIFDGFPTVYVEIDDNYNFTRVYFEATITNGNTCEDCVYATDALTADDSLDVIAPESSSMTITADLNLSYPNEFTIEEPEEYVNMSTLLNTVMTNLLTNGSGA